MAILVKRSVNLAINLTFLKSKTFFFQLNDEIFQAVKKYIYMEGQDTYPQGN